MFLLGHSLSLSALTTLLFAFYNLLEICETKSDKVIKDIDLMYSDTSHGLQTAGAHQQVVFIDHGGGAISQIRRTTYNHPNPSVPSLPFRPHVNHYPNSLYENNFADEPYLNLPEDIPRIFERRIGETTPNPIEIEPQSPPEVPLITHDFRSRPPQPNTHQSHPSHPQHIIPPQPITHPITHPITQPIAHPIPHPVTHPIPQPIPQPIAHPIPQHIPQPPIRQPIPQSYPQPIEPDIEDERFLIHNEIERIPRPSNRMNPTRSQLPTPEAPISPLFNIGESPELFSNFDTPFDPFSPQISPLFQRRRLTSNNNNNNNNNINNNINNNNVQELNHNSLGYPSYTYYKGGDENPSLTNWPKIFKFTDGRSNLYDFEKQKKQNKIKFNAKEAYFDHISRDSFLILHGGTFAQ